VRSVVSPVEPFGLSGVGVGGAGQSDALVDCCAELQPPFVCWSLGLPRSWMAFVEMDWACQVCRAMSTLQDAALYPQL